MLRLVVRLKLVAESQAARELLTMSQDEFSAAFEDLLMKRTNLRGLKSNAAVVLGNVDTADDVDAFTRALDDPEALLRELASHRLGRMVAPDAQFPES